MSIEKQQHLRLNLLERDVQRINLRIKSGEKSSKLTHDILSAYEELKSIAKLRGVKLPK